MRWRGGYRVALRQRNTEGNTVVIRADDRPKGDVVIGISKCLPDAQRHIQEIIKHFQNQYGAGFVAVEGASQELDAQIFKSFPDQEKLKLTTRMLKY